MVEASLLSYVTTKVLVNCCIVHVDLQDDKKYFGLTQVRIQGCVVHPPKKK